MPKTPPSFFLPAPVAGVSVVSLDEAGRRHALARRLRRGSRVRVSGADGFGGEGTIQRLDRSTCEIRLDSSPIAPVSASPPAGVALYVPAIRMPRLSWLVEKATELGASSVTIVASARAQRERVENAARARERLARIAREAAGQSRQAWTPALAGPVSRETALSKGGAYASSILLDLSGAPFPARIEGPVALWIGPEGGWAPGEIDAAEASGWTCARLPGGVLRSETAAIAALVLSLRAIDTAAELDGQ